MTEFTSRMLEELLGISKMALSKALKNTPWELKRVEGSAKAVKHYRRKDLPQRYREILDEKLGEVEDEEIDSSIFNEDFSQKYLLAPENKRNEAVLRCKLIDFAYERDTDIPLRKWLTSVTPDFIDIAPLNESKFYRWRNDYEDARTKGANVVEAMLDFRGTKKGSITLTTEHKNAAVNYFIGDDNVNINTIYTKMALRYGDTLPSRETLRRYYKQWKLDNPLMYEFVRTPDGFKNKYMPAYGSASEKAKHKNHYWELDSTPADIITSDGKRKAVVAMIDVFSRRALFYVADRSSSYTISQMLRLAILKYGIPDNVVVDNGKDYKSNHFESICYSLNINIITVPPFSGDMKPHIERVFRTMSHKLFEQLPGYSGHNVAQKSDLQARVSFASKMISQNRWNEEQRIKSDEQRAAFTERWKKNKENRGLKLDLALTADELQTWLDKWTTNIYEQENHRGIKTSPIKMWNSCPIPVKQIPDNRMLDLLLGELVKRKINKKGISLDGATYYHSDIVEHSGKHVMVLAPTDLGYLLVYDAQMRFICIAEDPTKMGHNRYQIQAAKKKYQALARKADKIVKEVQALKGDNPTYMDVIDKVENLTTASTVAVKKSSPMIDQLLTDNNAMVKADKKELEKSRRYDFTKKDEAGVPEKLLQSGRPAFRQLYDRFLWDMENDRIDENTKTLAAKNSHIWEMAQTEYERKKTG